MNKKQRLTIRNSDGTVSQPTDTTFEKAMYRLASYEDLGYTPEELRDILSRVDAEFREGDIVNKVYIMCNKKETECDCPGKCADCTDDDFCAHISSVVYTKEKACELRRNIFANRESTACKEAFADLENKINTIKAVMNDRDSIKVYINSLFKDGSRFKAIATVAIGNRFAVHDIRIYNEPEKGLVVIMPMVRQKTESGYMPMSAFHATDANLNKRIRTAVLDAYQKALDEVEGSV